ncbi:MAG: TetR/AcrR family transcriptional regulator [Microcella sp.]
MTSRARDAIVEAAFRLFLERGYEATSLARILQTVPYSKGAVYHHFASKEALLDAVIERFFTQLVTAESSPLPPDADAAAVAHRMVDDYVDMIDGLAPYATPLAYHAFLTSVAVRARDAIRAAHELVTADLAEALDSHAGSPEAARHLAADLVALVEGAGMLAALRGEELDRAALHSSVDRALSARST